MTVTVVTVLTVVREIKKMYLPKKNTPKTVFSLKNFFSAKQISKNYFVFLQKYISPK